MVDIYYEIAMAFWILFPAYAANTFAPFSKFIKNKHPVDFGKKIGGKRILGTGKTWEGFIFGLVAGTLVGVAETLAKPALDAFALQWNMQFIPMTIFIGFMIALGALVGDMFGSFVKRRFGMKRGADAPLLDQLDFILGAIVFSYFFTSISIWMILIMVVLTPIFHRISCIIGYKIKMKNEPW